MDSTSTMNATGSCLKIIKTPTTRFIKSSPERSSSFIDLPSNSALQSNTTRFSSQVFPKGDISHLLAYPLIRRSFINYFVILEEPFIFQESSFETFQPSECLDSVAWHHQIFTSKQQRDYIMIIFLHSSFLQNMQTLSFFY